MHQIRLHPRAATVYISRDRAVLAADRTGVIEPGGDHGFYVHETRLLSRWRYRIAGRAPEHVVSSPVEPHRWLGYFIAFPPEERRPGPDRGSGRVRDVAQRTLELRVARSVGPGLVETLSLANYTPARTLVRLAVEVDSDFADHEEALRGGRLQRGAILWTAPRRVGGVLERAVEYRIRRPYRHQGGAGWASLRRGFLLRVEPRGVAARWHGRRLVFVVPLGPQGRWEGLLRLIPTLDGRPLGGPAEAMEERRALFLAASTRIRGRRRPEVRGDGAGGGEAEDAEEEDLTATVVATLERARHDLAALRLYDLDHGPQAWTVAAGLPVYVALFGRDTQAAAWQAAMLGPELMRGTLQELARWQGRTLDDWRDEQPGRMLHEAHTGPLGALNLLPRGRYYGSVNSSTFYPLAVSELWHWTGDADLVRALIPPALAAIAWTDRHADLDGDGFFEYRTRSTMGVRHQGWKDSGDAVVDAEGRQVEPPIATCEEQGFVYVAWLHFAEVLYRLGHRDDARRLYRRAQDLKRRFNDRFWMPEPGFYAFGLDSRKRQITSIASNPGHALAAGIVDRSRAAAVAARLLQPDLFSGWGVRTLAAGHPAYNPYSYHRGSVWPVEQATFALGCMRYGLHTPMHVLARAFFDAASLFELCRLPEVFSGHPRDAAHPFPALYPRANWPQAWSASAAVLMLQALLGLYPYAPMGLLFVDPHLPPWLPEVVVERLRVGGATVSLRFFRGPDGGSGYRVLDARGRLRVLRQPSPWSVTATTGERIGDLLESLLPGR